MADAQNQITQEFLLDNLTDAVQCSMMRTAVDDLSQRIDIFNEFLAFNRTKGTNLE